MFKEKEITAAFEKLFGLFDKEELCGEDEVPILLYGICLKKSWTNIIRSS